LKKAIKSSVLRPIRIQIPNTLFDPTINGQEHTVCLFCRTDDKEEIENELERNPITGLNKVITLSDLKKYYKNFQERKKLFKEFTHFLCDNRLFSHVINLLGKVFTSRNNYPIPIEMSKIDKLSAAVNKSINQSTYLSLSGTLLSIRFGLTNMSSKKIIDNILAGLPIAFEKLQFGFGSVNSIHLKSSDSPALPIHYSHQNEISEFLKAKVNQKKDKTAPATGAEKKNQKENKKTTAAVVVAANEEIDAPVAPSAAAGKKKNKKVKAEEEVPATVAVAAIETIKPFSSPVNSQAVAIEKAKAKKGKQTKAVVPETIAVVEASAPPAPVAASPADTEKTANKKKKQVVAKVEAAPEPIVGKKRIKGAAAAVSEVEERVETSAKEKTTAKKSKLRK
jgi:ribosome biogenesis protein UTP30